jgi:hypothetical protein
MKADIHALVLGPSTQCPLGSMSLGTGAGLFKMPSGIFRYPATPDDDFQAQQRRDFDRLRTAIELVQRLREAGIDCQLSDGSQPRE